ncbi:MAG: serine/threonine protein kinase [Saprospiraceae bacterium]|nr:serine/threonine protein kinase [Saprospiraceae bacterium]
MNIDISNLDLDNSVIDFIKTKEPNIDFDNSNEKGSNGLLLFGHHKLLKKRIALKFYYYENGIHDEVELLASIKNDNILPILDAGVIDENNAFFMTEEVCAGDLDDLISTNKKSYQQAIGITRGILNGLVEMHSSKNKLLHRDLKPANILLAQNNTPLIADFGSVKRIPDDADGVNGSRHAALYRPPEAYENFYTYSSDVYQVGLVLYQLLGGYLPYEEKAYLNKKQKIKFDKLPSSYDKSKYVDSIIFDLSKKGKLIDLNSLPPFVDEKLKSIIRKATQPNFLKRYQTCSEFIHALHEFGLGEDWTHSFEFGYKLDIDGKTYRIERQNNGKYACMKSTDNGSTWRREAGVADNSENKVVYDLKNKIRK